MDTAPKPPFFDELMALRGDLLRFARLQLRDTASAEDAVQETLISALAGAARGHAGALERPGRFV